MQDLNDKINNGGASAAGQLSADEWNQPASEIQNVIEETGQALSVADLNQLGKGIAQYVANGDFYTDSGGADAYILAVVNSKQRPNTYLDGMKVRFSASNVNTGASTINVAGLGVKSITDSGGNALIAGDVLGDTKLEFDLANDRFTLVKSGLSSVVSFQASTTYNPSPGVKSLEFTVIGAGGGSGGVGATASNTEAAGGAGASGAMTKLIVTNIEASYAITIGAGGVGGVGAANGGNGGLSAATSTFISAQAPGGGGGVGMDGSAAGKTSESGAPATVAFGGDINLPGESASPAIVRLSGADYVTTSLPVGVRSPLGGSTLRSVSSTPAQATAPGAGGTPVSNPVSQSATNGGTGALGIVIIKENF